MKKFTTRYACLLAMSRLSAILINVLGNDDRIISVYSTDSYLSVKFHGLFTQDDVKKIDYSMRTIFGDFPIQPTWTINFANDKDCPLDFSKADSSICVSLPSITDRI